MNFWTEWINWFIFSSFGRIESRKDGRDLLEGNPVEATASYLKVVDTDSELLSVTESETGGYCRDFTTSNKESESLKMIKFIILWEYALFT